MENCSSKSVALFGFHILNSNYVLWSRSVRWLWDCWRNLLITSIWLAGILSLSVCLSVLRLSLHPHCTQIKQSQSLNDLITQTFSLNWAQTDYGVQGAGERQPWVWRVSWEYVITNIKLQVVALEWKVAHTPRCLPARQAILGSCLYVCLSVFLFVWLSVCLSSAKCLSGFSHQPPLHPCTTSTLLAPFATLHQLPSWAKTAIQAIFNFRCNCRRATSSRHKLHITPDKSPRYCCHPLMLFDRPSSPCACFTSNWKSKLVALRIFIIPQVYCQFFFAYNPSAFTPVHL